MKSLEDLYKEVQANEEQKTEFVSAVKEGRTEDFLKAHDCEATAGDVRIFLNNVKEESAAEDDLTKVAGGWCSSSTCGNTCGCYSYTAAPNGLEYCQE